MKSTALLVSALLTLGFHSSILQAQENTPAYLFSYFIDNGQDGLHLAYSNDGLTWSALKNGKSFLTPQVGGKLMRDPCICQGPDGTFHMVWTSSWWDKGIGIAHSKDLVTWTEQTFLPVMTHEDNAKNCWAPEIFYDKPTQTYLIYWSTTIPGRFPETEPNQGGDLAQGVVLNHRIYCVTTQDFETYSDTRLFYNDNFNVIDATIVKNGAQYVLFVKDETKAPIAKKNIRMATSDKVQGPYGPASEPISPNGLWVEGPTALKIGEYWYLYYDAYTSHHYAGQRSKDLKTWEDITDNLTFPNGTRHGTAFKVSKAVLDKLLEEK